MYTANRQRPYVEREVYMYNPI